MGGGAVAKAVHRDYILADRMAVAIEVMDLELERAGIVARVANLAFDRHPVAASNQAGVSYLHWFHPDQ